MSGQRGRGARRSLRSLLQAGALLAGLALIALLCVDIVGIVYESPALALAADIGWIVMIGAIVIGAWIAIGKAARSRDRNATRLANIERDRAGDRGMADDIRQLQTGLARLAATAEQQNAGLVATSGAMDAAEAQRHELTEAVGALQATIEETAPRLESGLEALRADLVAVENASVKQAASHDEDVAGLLSGMEALTARVDEYDARLAELSRQLVEAEASLSTQTQERDEAWALSARAALRHGADPRAVLDEEGAAELFRRLIEGRHYLETAPLVRDFDLLGTTRLGTNRVLYRTFRDAGYWVLAHKVVQHIATVTGLPNDVKTARRLGDEIEFFRRPVAALPSLERTPAHTPDGPVLHVVGKTLPTTQSGYTLRTHRIAAAQKATGLRVAVVGHSGASGAPADRLLSHAVDGVDYYVLPGPERGKVRTARWIERNARELSRLVQRLRPSVLHAHSDFHNALLVHAVGLAHGIPTIYESRGFWEESWLSRQSAAGAWGPDQATAFTAYGLPDAYALRSSAEATARGLVDRNITLAETMRQHILSSSANDLRSDQIAVVPNAVDPQDFPVQRRDQSLAASLGIPRRAVTIGYVSSMVAYEGIETLIDAVGRLEGRTDLPIRLVLVGDGPILDVLKARARARGILDRVVFTGAVPYYEVPKYFGLIDIFVVPRAKSTVADIVTPLKPFEAFSTGRAVVMSNVDALREIADDSESAVVFRADDVDDLAEKLRRLVDDEPRCLELSLSAARWVRGNRTWEGNARAYERVYRTLGLRRRVHRAPRASTALTRRDNAEGTAAPTPKKVVVVAMKPQIAGRIRRNIQTMLDLGAEVVVVNMRPRSGFFQGLEHPNLSADFIDVESLAVKYQGRMTRKNRQRRERWALERLEEAGDSARNADPLPAWIQSGVPGTGLAARAWMTPGFEALRHDVREKWTQADKTVTKRWNAARQQRDLWIRDTLKNAHLVNRFVEFWRLSPDRIQSHQPDLIISSDLPGLVGASIAAARLGVPHLHDCHELYLESTTIGALERKLLAPVEKHYMRRADAVIVVNESIRDEYRRRYGVMGSVVRNCAPRVPQAVLDAPCDLRGMLGLPADSKILLYQGGLAEGRGLDVCVKAMASLEPNVHLVMIGKGRLEQDLRRLAVDEGVDARVHFVPQVDPGELARYTAGADLGVIPYQPVSENNRLTLPNKLFEFTAAGIPFVAADAPEIQKVTGASGCGVVYDPFDAASLAEAVGTVLDGAVHSRFRADAASYGRENSWETEREIIVTTVHRLMGGDGGRRDARKRPSAAGRLRIAGGRAGSQASPRVAMVVHNGVRHDARVLKTAGSLREAGFDVRVFGLTQGEAEDFLLDGGIPVHLESWDRNLISERVKGEGVAPGKENSIRASFRIQGEALFGAVRERMIPDVVHIHDHVALTAAEKYRAAFGCGVVWDAHEIYEDLANLDPARAAVNARIVRAGSFEVDGFITLNESIGRFYTENYPALPPATLIPNAVSEGHGPAVYDGRLHNAAGIRSDQRVVLFQGGFSPHRGIPALLEAAMLLGEEWTVVFMGWGKLGDLIHEYAVRDTERPGDRPAVAVIPAVPHDELLGWTAGADLGAIPYEDTGLNHLYCSPNKLWEYPAAGVPILATDMPEMTRRITENGIGITVPRSLDPAEIAAAINALSDSDLGTMRRNARQFAARDNWQAYVPRLIGLYEELLRRR
ncbi:glycosyltransferase [Brachybacterium timonense]|uniref:glycosyltransferase n=1 Tax=Brachybacterium timonense TaxID=2050896 RepID=UPI000D0B3541|nr:glycosyltransferase [Brachybacterium timonense]